MFPCHFVVKRRTVYEDEKIERDECIIEVWSPNKQRLINTFVIAACEKESLIKALSTSK